MKKNNTWVEVLAASFGVSLDEKQSVAWFIEARNKVKRWAYKDDPLKDGAARAIHAELRDIIRWAADKDHVPRAKDGEGKPQRGRVNIRDIALWAWLRQKELEQQNQKTDSVNRDLVEKARQIIGQLLSDGRKNDARMVSEAPDTVPDQWNTLIEIGGNRAYTASERAMIRAHYEKLVVAEDF